MPKKIALFCIWGFGAVFVNEILKVTSTTEFLAGVGPSKLPYVYIFCGIIGPISTILLNSIYNKTGKYYYVMFFYLVLLLGAVCGVYAAFASGYALHSTWVYFIIGQLNALLLEMFTWNLLGRYFNMFDAKKIFPIFVSVTESGAIAGDILIERWLYAKDIQFLTSFSFIFIIGLIIGLFLVSRLRPVQYGAATEEEGGEENRFRVSYLKEHFILFLILLVAIYQILGTSITYQFNSMVEATYKDTESINKFLAIYEMLTSVAIIIFSIVIGKFIVPFSKITRLQTVLCIVLTASVFGIWMFPLFPIYVAAEFMRGTLDGSVYVTVLEQSVSTLTTRLSLAVKTVVDGLTTPAMVVLASFFLLCFPKPTDFFYLNLILVGLGAIWILFSFRYAKAYLKYHFEGLHNKERETVIRSIQALGEYKNYPAVDVLLQLLNEKAPHLVRKYTILSLGNIRATEVMKVLFKEIYADNEDIQQTTITSLASYHSFIAERFLIDFLYGKYCKSLLVRESLIRVLYKLLGEPIVPLLLPYLENEDQRVVANTIEAMVEVKNPEICSILGRFLDHPNNRVRANTVFVLYRFKKMRERCKNTLQSLSQSSDPKDVTSYIYIVGRMRLKRHAKHLNQLLFTTSDKGIKLNLAFALSNMGQQSGNEAFSKIFLQEDVEFVSRSLHHFLQLGQGIRFRILEEFLRQASGAQLAKFIDILKGSKFDFFEELEILEDCLGSMNSKTQPAPATA